MLLSPISHEHVAILAETATEYQEYWKHTQLMTMTYSSALALILFEYAITFDREMSYAWCRKVTWPRVLFLLNRYIHPVSGMAALLAHSLPASFFRAREVCTVIILIIMAAFSGMRVYALSEHSKAATLVVVVFASVPVVMTTIIEAHTSLSLIPRPDLGIPPLCKTSLHLAGQNIMRLDVGMRVAFLVALAADALIILAAIVRAWSVSRGQSSLWTTLLLREGVLYFAVQLVWGVWNMTAIAVSTATLHSTVLTGTDMAMVNVYLSLLPSILISRFYLNVHELHEQDLQKQKASEPNSPPGTFEACDLVKEEGYRTSYVFEVLVYNGRNHQPHIV